MTYQEWKEIKKIKGADNERIIRNFELSNPYTASQYEQMEQEEYKEMQKIMKESDRMKRWKKISKSAYAHDPDFAARRQREVM